jgi:Protein kinase domain
MTPERWADVERLYHAALTRGGHDRGAFLAEACAGDDVLRREVESLLAQESAAVGFMSTPAAALASRRMSDPMQCRECYIVLPADARFCLSCGARVEPVAADSPVDLLRQSLEKAIGFQYRIERLLGRGGMGAVYLAHELALDRDVAIKVLSPDQASTPQSRDRFRQEARTAARLNHPHIVPLHTFGEVAGLIYFVMGYVAGESLASRLKHRGALESEEVRTLLVALCDALDYAHRQGIVHRDIKPDNILIDGASGAPLLTDFGIAKATFAKARLTSTGQLIGTPHYMSPEQALGRSDVGPRSDLYSLGLVAYEMVSGHRPFDAESSLEALTQRLMHDAKPLGSVRPGVAPDLALAIDRCLENDPANRWLDARSLRATLSPSDEDGEASLTERLLRLGVAMMGLTLLALSYLAIFAAFNPGSLRLLPRGFGGMPAGIGLVSVILTVGAAIQLRREGLDAKDIARRAFQQPHWWRPWYPRSLRRSGDVFDRLPRPLRRFRVFWCMALIYFPGAVVPIVLAMRAAGPPWEGVAPLIMSTEFIALAAMYLMRYQAVKFVSLTLGTSSAEASKIVSTSTWRVSAWRRAPAASLLSGVGRAPFHDGHEPAGLVTHLSESTDNAQTMTEPSNRP